MLFLFFQKLLKIFSDLIFPIECVGCEKNDQFLCCDCVNKIKTIPVHLCHYCGKLRAFGRTCADCANSNRLDGLFVLSPYDQPVLKDAIHIWKYERVKAIGNILGHFFARRLQDISFPVAENTVIIPVPLHPQKQFDRGFNQSEQIGQILAKNFQIHSENFLIKTKNTKSQFSLSREKRLKNIKGVFTFSKNANAKGKNIFLIDDITTTGATLEEAGKILKKSGARSVFGLALAHGK